MSDTLTVQEAAIRLRNRLRWASISILAFLAITVVLSHLIAPSDARLLGGRKVKVTAILTADMIQVRTETGLTESVKLLGVAPPPEKWANDATGYLNDRLHDKVAVIQFDGTQTRAADGTLLALVYPTDNECINLSVVQYGHAFVDRRVDTFLSGQFSQLENDARKKHRGMWDGMQYSDQPAWRIEWLKKRFAATTHPDE